LKAPERGVHTLAPPWGYLQTEKGDIGGLAPRGGLGHQGAVSLWT